ncbi:MAG: lysine--tRNA ligase [Clostridia bacterium]|nr:lysine--tRNA ligase [Clostridia bacterium]
MSNEQNRQPQVEVVDENEQIQIRREKLEKLVAEGKNPFEKVRFDKNASSQDIKNNVAQWEGKQVKIAGRIVSRRIMGKASFAHVLDGQGTIQMYVRIDALGADSYAEFKTWDIGDIVGATGEVFVTHMGEPSVRVTEIELLAKSLIPLPEKYHGLTNTDLRYRQRYVDLIVNPEVKKTFEIRSKIINEIRNYLNQRDFIEVETPILNTVASGANARPFVTHHNTLDIDMHLRIAPELYLKRLIVGGFERVYEIGRNFRNEGMDTKHNPEFTMIELYQAYTDYHGMMDMVEGLYKHCCDTVLGTRKVVFEDVEIDFDNWTKLTMVEAVEKYCGVNFDQLSQEQAVATAKSLGVELEKNKLSWGDVLFQVFDQKVEEKLVQPTFIYDYPIEVSPLTKKKPTDSRLTERFEFFVCARECGNAYSELNDPIDQAQRFLAQAQNRAAGDDESMATDDDFVNALSYGMPPTGGLGIGIDRMVMFFTNQRSIRDVLLFPTMKPLNK